MPGLTPYRTLATEVSGVFYSSSAAPSPTVAEPSASRDVRRYSRSSDNGAPHPYDQARSSGRARLDSEVVQQAIGTAYNWTLRAPHVTNIWVVFASGPAPVHAAFAATAYRVYGQILAWNEVPSWIIPGAQERSVALNPPLLDLWRRYCEGGKVGVDHPARVVLCFTPGGSDINVDLQWEVGEVGRAAQVGLSPAHMFQMWMQRLRETGEDSATFKHHVPGLLGAPAGEVVPQTTVILPSPAIEDPMGIGDLTLVERRRDSEPKPRSPTVAAPGQRSFSMPVATEEPEHLAPTVPERPDTRTQRLSPTLRPASTAPTPLTSNRLAFLGVFGALVGDLVRAAWEWTGSSADIEVIWICLADTGGVPVSTVVFRRAGKHVTPSELGGQLSPAELTCATLMEWRDAVTSGPVGTHHPGMIVIRGDMRESTVGIDQVRWEEISDSDVEEWATRTKAGNSAPATASRAEPKSPAYGQMRTTRALPTPPASPLAPNLILRQSSVRSASPLPHYVPSDVAKNAFLGRFRKHLADILYTILTWPKSRDQVAVVWVYLTHVNSKASVCVLMDGVAEGISLAVAGGCDPAHMLAVIGKSWLLTCVGVPNVDYPTGIVLIVRPNAGPSLSIETTWDTQEIDWPEFPEGAVWRAHTG